MQQWGLLMLRVQVLELQVSIKNPLSQVQSEKFNTSFQRLITSLRGAITLNSDL